MAGFPIIDGVNLQAAIAQGDDYAFTLLYNKFYPLVFGFARHLLKSDELAIDIVQESMLHIWQLGPKLESVNNLESYLKTFTKRRVIDILRHRAVEQKADKFLGTQWNEGHNDTEESILLNESRKILQDGLLVLPPQQRLVYELCHQDGLKYEEAAQRMGISAGTVKTHLKLAMRSLREHVKKHTDVVAILILLKIF